MAENSAAKGGQTEPKGGKSAAAFRTISEVSSELDIPQHVLRFWETKFTQVKPMKRAGGRRYYRPEDVQLLSRIRDLLYSEGYTIRGVQKLLREKGPKGLLAEPEVNTAPTEAPVEAAAPVPEDTGPQGSLFPLPPPGMPAATKTVLREVLAELKEIRASL
ncbi:MerR family transcriptional regulator [Hwanghaeella grinnelliae]|uniref:MerR family transcriptional regulator n=1 Tax=Hwanghaeella grinnelliae TaxID=2500179 RepID=A0A437QYP9_9PROT|nr:MerR family transcriptional regulator [Hwanghaeella grinnelliae]RVU39619.1 MerR family transcriptional regulator [Hwanghaeella grinnelliae]